MVSTFLSQTVRAQADQTDLNERCHAEISKAVIACDAAIKQGEVVIEGLKMRLRITEEMDKLQDNYIKKLEESTHKAVEAQSKAESLSLTYGVGGAILGLVIGGLLSK